MPDSSLSTHRPRIAVSEAASLHMPDGTVVACSIADVSAEGFRLKIGRGIPCGQGYALVYGGESHAVEIRWASMGEVGGLFI